MLLDFTADWCVPCKAMDRDFWSRQDVAELSQRLSCVRVNYDRFVSASAGFYQRALKSPTAKRDPKLRGDVLVALGWSHVNDNETKRAREDFARALEVPDLERADVALFGLVVTNLALGRRGDAEKAFAELSIRFPDSQAMTAARARLEPSAKTGQR